MFHNTTEKADPPTEAGEPCRLTNACTPIELYFEYQRPAPEKEVGGPRSYVLSAGGRVFSVPTHQLTTAAPMSCDSFAHAELHANMVEIHVTKTRKSPTVPGGKPRRETSKDRRERLDRWDREITGGRR